MNYIAIMAGGVGSRFWPSSREATPKQFLDILGVGKSLLQLTFERSLRLVPAENILIVTNARYKSLVLAQLPSITAAQVLCEPSRNNTAPCIAYTGFKLQQRDPEAVFAVLPSDHVVLKETEFVERMSQAFDAAAANEAIITLGISPTRPDTGYGYIQYQHENTANAICKVTRFTEKPDHDTAQKFLDTGEYVWNAGIFIWSTKTLLGALKMYATEVHDILAEGYDTYNTADEQAFIDANYPLTPNISIDYAVMEKASNVFTLPADIGWSDLGTWGSLYAESDHDTNQNAVQIDNTILDGTKGCLVRAPSDKIIIIKDLEDYIIVDEGDVLMIWPRKKEQEIKQLTAKVGARFGKELL